MDELAAAELIRNLGTRTLGRRAVMLDTVDSTNLEVRRLLEQSVAEGVAVIADRQTLGRGRRGRQWVSEAGCGLWMSLGVKPCVPQEQMQQMTLAVGVAVCKAIEAVTDNAARPIIKWPNDIIVEGKKLCGILCESVSTLPLSPASDTPLERGTSSNPTNQAAAPFASLRREVPRRGGGSAQEWFIVVGIGVNTRKPRSGWGEAEGIAISLEDAAGRIVPRTELAAAILNELEPLLDSMRTGGFAAIAAEYRKRMLPVGSAVIVVDGATNPRCGRIEGVEDSGTLLVRLESGELERIVSGEISLRGVSGYV